MGEPSQNNLAGCGYRRGRENNIVFAVATEQLVGPERRERVAKAKGKRQKEKDFAPPGQL